jgi:hypothetical protein
MSVKNKYVKHAHISEAKFRQIILLFSEDLSATQISHLTKVSRPTVNKYLTAIRLRILELSLLQADLDAILKQLLMNFLLTVDRYLFKYFGDMILDCLLGMVNSWLVIQATSVNAKQLTLVINRDRGGFGRCRLEIN